MLYRTIAAAMTAETKLFALLRNPAAHCSSTQCDPIIFESPPQQQIWFQFLQCLLDVLHVLGLSGIR